jgi:catechol 2,3-dioxygenase
MRKGEVCIRVLDMQESRRHYDARLGLHEVFEDTDGRVYLKGWNDLHGIVAALSSQNHAQAVRLTQGGIDGN